MVANELIGDVQPEWKTDGFGLRGEQVEPSDDDDLVWDTDVWTRLNPEQDAIAGSEPVTCPGFLGLTLDSIAIACSCQSQPDERTYTFRDFPNGDALAAFAHDDGDICYLSVALNITLDIYAIGNPCPGTPSTTTTPILSVIFGRTKSDGKWYCAIISTDADANRYIFFYGGGSTIVSDPISNTVSGCGTFSAGDAFYTTLFGVPLIADGSGGTVTAAA